ncbi:M48 family metalloprotease [Pedobacter sp. PWIIR3]
MQANALKVSENFRRMAVKSVLSIVLFLATYVVMIILGLGVIALCGLIAYTIVMLKAMSITVMVAIGFLGMGFLIFYFLIKFVFSSAKKMDRSHLLEIKEQQQPELFKLIRELVAEVQTQFPKKVYLSSEVNAAVFYDSNFWSMFFPVRKNLQIGIGLMNTVSVIELKAILAHEFGHFSQRSMKVGSYVYNVNKVIYNMLYDNDGYSSMLNRWSSASSYFIIFSKGALLVVQGIQYVLMKVYRVLNLNYMALSREMEFHADAVAASVTGSAPLANSLLRMGLASQSLSTVLDYYGGKITDLQKTNNFYPQQYFILNHLAKAEGLPVEGGLPNITTEVYKKFNKTKLVLDDQWSSHPSTDERVRRLLALNLPLKGEQEGIAIDLLSDKDQIQELITSQMFEAVSYEAEPIVAGTKDFIDDYLTIETSNSYPTIFKGYFAERNPYVKFAVANLADSKAGEVHTFDALFGEESLAVISTLQTAQSDKVTLEQIKEGLIEIKTFDYDGVKYTPGDTDQLINFLEGEIAKCSESLDKKDEEIFQFFLAAAIRTGKQEEFKLKSIHYKEFSERMTAQQDAYVNLVNATYFMQTSTPFAQIKDKLVGVKKLEEPFKDQLKQMLAESIYSELIDSEMRARFDEYLSNDWKYFGYDMYFDKEVDLLFHAINDFYYVVYKSHFKLKKELLEFYAVMVKV